MRVLFSSTAGHGHVFPMVPLARAIAAAGHDVLWAGHASVAELIIPAGLSPAPAGLQGAKFTAARDDIRRRAARLAPTDRAAFVFPHGFGSTFTPAMTADLLALAKEWRPDLLIHEQAELASPLVGALLGVPSVTQSYGSAIPPSFLIEAGDRLAGLWHAHGLAIPPYAGCFDAPFLDICPPSIRPVPLDHVPFVQPLRPVLYAGPEPSSLPLPAGTAPLIYLTLGTIPGTTATLSGVLAALATLPVRIIATIGPEGDAAAIGEQPAHIAVAKYAPQTQVLPHSDAVVSHAGSGTFLGALAHGLPQLCLPQAADQFRNAHAGVESGAALKLHPEHATPEAIADAVSTLLADNTFRTNANRIRTEINTMPAPDKVTEILQTPLDSGHTPTP